MTSSRVPHTKLLPSVEETSYYFFPELHIHFLTLSLSYIFPFSFPHLPFSISHFSRIYVSKHTEGCVIQVCTRVSKSLPILNIFYCCPTQMAQGTISGYPNLTNPCKFQPKSFGNKLLTSQPRNALFRVMQSACLAG